MADTGPSPAHARANASAFPRSAPPRFLDWVVLYHSAILGIVTAWAFGGQSPGARLWLQVWGTAGMALFLLSLVLLRPREAGLGRRVGQDIWPLLLFDLLVLLSLFNPTLRTVLQDHVPHYMLVEAPRAWLPGCARPDLALPQLWMLNGLLLSAYNPFLVLRRRPQIRLLLLLGTGNAVILAVFGTFQNLVHAPGLYFGLVPSPQEYFFSTFVYPNHWGAFILLNTAAGLGLLFQALRRREHRDLWHSPVLAGAVALLFLCATVPLSASRSSSVLLALLLLAAWLHFLSQMLARHRTRRESPLRPVAGIILLAGLAAGGVAFLARDVIAQRAQQTVSQLRELQDEEGADSRLTLYQDTWRMAREHPWFGWGLESYGDIFRVYNTQRVRYDGVHYWQPYYRSAHNDWLQAWAETGLVGTGLIVLLVLLPLAGVPWRRVSSPLPFCLLAGCGLIVLYAGVEFPFANPSVIFAFWTSFYLALAYAGLDRTEPPAASPS